MNAYGHYVVGGLFVNCILCKLKLNEVCFEDILLLGVGNKCIWLFNEFFVCLWGDGIKGILL